MLLLLLLLARAKVDLFAREKQNKKKFDGKACTCVRVCTMNECHIFNKNNNSCHSSTYLSIYEPKPKQARLIITEIKGKKKIQMTVKKK